MVAQQRDALVFRASRQVIERQPFDVVEHVDDPGDEIGRPQHVDGKRVAHGHHDRLDGDDVTEQLAKAVCLGAAIEQRDIHRA